jgi:flagella basal body P-ring formation protein FlgA
MAYRRTIIFQLLLFFLFCATAAQGMEKRVLDSSFFKEIFFQKVTAHTPWQKADLAIDNFTVFPEKLTVKDGALSYTAEGPPPSGYLGRQTLNLQIMVDGLPAGVVKLGGDLLLFRDVVCLKQGLSRHAVLSPADVELVRRNATFLGNDLVTRLEDAVGQRLRSSLRAGTALSSTMLEAVPLVYRGDLVTIIAQSDHFSITAPGEARSAGAKGEMVKVKNLMSRKEIFARVVSSEVVAVDL